PIIKLNQAWDMVSEEDDQEFKRFLLPEMPGMIRSYLDLLDSGLSGNLNVGVPKFSSRRIISETLGVDVGFSDRSLMTLILKPGEFFHAREYKSLPEGWNLNSLVSSGFLDGHEFNLIREHLRNLCVVYYRPNEWAPAFRLDIPEHHFNDEVQFSTILKAVKTQCFSPLFEPFPLYLADRMVKSLRTSIPPIKQAIIQQLALKFDRHVDLVYFNLHSYRTEEGF
ncbi:MAG: DNA double-strand break repair nuclease NurA, partial [Candidatus Helarchaeales archaeon]